MGQENKEHKKTELMELMARYSPHGLVVIDRQGRWLLANQAFTEITGYTKEDIPDGRAWFEKAFPEEALRGRVKSLWKEDLAKGQTVERELEIVCKNGQKKWLSMRSSFLPEGQVVLSFHDISLRKKLEKEKEKTEEFYRTLLETIPDMVVIADEQGLITYASDLAVRFLGYDRAEEILGKNNQEFFPSEEAQTLAIIGETIQKTGVLGPLVATIQKRDGTKRTVEISMSHILPRENQPGSYIAIFRDVTDRFLLEQRLRHMLEEKEVLLREVHHRVKNNLQLIVSLLRLQFYQSKDPQVQNALKDAINRVRSIALVYESLLRAEGVDRINLKNYAEKIVAHVLSLYKEKSEKVQVKMELEDIEVDISLAHPCGLIISELTTNALKHAFPERTGQLSISLKKQDNHFITLTVADDGVGLPQDLSPANLDSLGWQIIHDLVDQLSGKIDIKVDKGTEIRITFPALPASMRA